MIEWIVAIGITGWMLLSWWVLPPRGAFAAWLQHRRRERFKAELRKMPKYIPVDTEFERTLRDLHVDDDARQSD